MAAARGVFGGERVSENKRRKVERMEERVDGLRKKLRGELEGKKENRS